jgi:hypothetical protein
MDDKDKIVAKLQFFGIVHGQLTQGRGKTMDAFFSLIPTLMRNCHQKWDVASLNYLLIVT